MTAPDEKTRAAEDLREYLRAECGMGSVGIATVWPAIEAYAQTVALPAALEAIGRTGGCVATPADTKLGYIKLPEAWPIGERVDPCPTDDT